MNKFILYVLVLALVLMAFVTGTYSGFFTADRGNDDRPVGEIRTFRDNGQEAVYVDGKPVIRLFSTTWCPHCNWIKDTYDRVVQEYVAEGKIIAYHWQLDTGDNTLTPETESAVPPSELTVFDKFNPDGSIPTFVFGEKYYRIGTAYERQQDLLAEEKEFRAVIEALL